MPGVWTKLCIPARPSMVAQLLQPRSFCLVRGRTPTRTSSFLPVIFQKHMARHLAAGTSGLTENSESQYTNHKVIRQEMNLSLWTKLAHLASTHVYTENSELRISTFCVGPLLVSQLVLRESPSHWIGELGVPGRSWYAQETRLCFARRVRFALSV